MNYLDKLTPEEFNDIDNKVRRFFEWCTKTDIIETYHNYQQYKNGVFNPFYSKVNFLTRILTDKNLILKKFLLIILNINGIHNLSILFMLLLIKIL